MPERRALQSRARSAGFRKPVWAYRDDLKLINTLEKFRQGRTQLVRAALGFTRETARATDPFMLTRGLPLDKLFGYVSLARHLAAHL